MSFLLELYGILSKEVSEKTVKKRAAAFILISFLFLLPVFSMNAETIYHASGDILMSMAESRGLSTDGTENEIRKRLYDYYGYEEVTIVADDASSDEDGSYTLVIQNADSVSSSGGLVTLEGNVRVDFNFSDTAVKTLTASTVIVDSSKSILSAIGDAVYTDSASDAAIKEISADILTVKWEKMDILLTGGSTSTERENSEKKKVTFSTSGERLSYLSGGAVIFDEGYITSNPKTAYSSISASSIMILPGEDMFLSSATFNIGRVPIFYLPFFFFPGSRILGNPSFGFSSDKGAFVNTTFELIGKYPDIESTDESSSFSSLLKSTGSNEGESVTGYYYSESGEKSALESFCEKTSSYLVLMADAYKGGSSATLLRKGGMHVALKGAFNLFDRKLKIAFSAGLATPLEEGDKAPRYYVTSSLSFSSWGFNAEMKVPLYSDQSVLYHYGNRLTGFSYGPLLGGTSKFPSDYSSSGITSFTRSFSLTYSLPSSVKIPLVSSFSIKNLSLEAVYSLSSSSRKALLSSYSLPSFSISLSGVLLSLRTDDSDKASSSGEENTGEKETPEVEEDEEKDILLVSPYAVAETESGAQKEKSVSPSAFTLSYNLSEDFSNRINKNTSTETNKDGKIASTFYTRFNAEGNISSVMTVSDVFTSSLSYTDSSDFALLSSTKKLTWEPLNTLRITVPYIGLVYNLSFKPFEYSSEEKSTGERSILSGAVEFTKTYIKSHSVSLSKSFSTLLGTFSGDISYILPPLDGSITPSLKWSGWGVSASLSWLFREKDKGYSSDRLSLSVSSSHNYVVFSSQFAYQTADYDRDDFWKPFSLTSSLRLKSSDSKYYMEGKVSGNGSTDGFVSLLTATLKLDEVTAVLTFRNTDRKFDLDSVNIRTNLSTRSFQLWKGRIYLAFSLDSTLFLSHSDRSRSYFTLSPSLTLSVAEFIDIKLSVKSQNSKLGSYYSDGKFSFSSMWKDLLRSVDFFGSGRYNTNFVLQSVSLDVVHYMEDWNLNFSYSTSFQKSTVGGKTIYTLQPSFSVYLAWNTMPDLKVQENWTKDSEGTWTRK